MEQPIKTECSMERIEFQELVKRKVIGKFDGGMITSDGGGLLLRKTESGLMALPKGTRNATMLLIHVKFYVLEFSLYIEGNRFIDISDICSDDPDSGTGEVIICPCSNQIYY